MFGPVACVCEQPLSNLQSENKNCQNDLQPEPPDHGLYTDGAPVCGKGKCQGQHGEQPQKTGESPHYFSPLLSFTRRVSCPSFHLRQSRDGPATFSLRAQFP